MLLLMAAAPLCLLHLLWSLEFPLVIQTHHATVSECEKKKPMRLPDVLMPSLRVTSVSVCENRLAIVRRMQ